MFATKLIATFGLLILPASQATSPQETHFDLHQNRRGQESLPAQSRWQYHHMPNGFHSASVDNSQNTARLGHQSRAVSAVLPANNQNVVSIDKAHGSAITNAYENLIEQGHEHSNQAKSGSHGTHSLDSMSAGNQGSLLSPNLEMVLRQASGDESVFQPSPTLGAIGHESYDWNSALHSATGGPKMEKASSGNGSSLSSTNLGSNFESNFESPVNMQLPISTTTMSSLVDSKIATNHKEHDSYNQMVEPVVLNHQQSILSNQKEFHADGNTSFEFNNQVIYEGPATPPSAASADDFYFSSSEKTHTNKELGNSYNGELPHSNAWWALGLEGEFERVSNLTRDDYLHYCDRSPLLVNNKQRSLCRMHPRVMSVVARGLRMSFEECQTRFSTSRWNCSLIVPTWLTSRDKAPSVFGEVMRRPNRERSFLNAIIAAGIAHSMTKACSQGELPEECSCDRKIRSKNNKGRVEWVACSDDIDFGARFSRDFTDNFDPNEPEATATIYIHNSEVGRRIFKSAIDITCTCVGGENGLCQTKRCWKHLGSYADIVEELVKRYEGATHVQRSSKDPHKLRPVRRGVRKPKRKDLVFIEESPDYCEQDSRMGVLGTQNRQCDSNSTGSDSCSLLCCNRGYQTVVNQIEEDCNCKFVWCCQVKCDKCVRFINNKICN